MYIYIYIIKYHNMGQKTGYTWLCKLYNTHTRIYIYINICIIIYYYIMLASQETIDEVVSQCVAVAALESSMCCAKNTNTVYITTVVPSLASNGHK